MHAWRYDGSFDGLLTAVSLLLDEGGDPEDLTPSGFRQGSLFAGERVVDTDRNRARRLMDALRERCGTRTVRAVAHVGLSEASDMEKALFAFVRLGLERGEDVTRYHANPCVKRVNDIGRKVGGEIHRFKGLLRFRDTKGGMLWAPFEPDHNVVVPVSLHFMKRLPAERWMVHDVRRGLAVVWNGEEPELREGGEFPELSEAEAEVQELWRTFHAQIAVAGRENPRLQRQFMPRRYWKYLVEKGG